MAASSRDLGALEARLAREDEIISLELAVSELKRTVASKDLSISYLRADLEVIADQLRSADEKGRSLVEAAERASQSLELKLMQCEDVESREPSLPFLPSDVVHASVEPDTPGERTETHDVGSALVAEDLFELQAVCLREELDLLRKACSRCCQTLCGPLDHYEDIIDLESAVVDAGEKVGTLASSIEALYLPIGLETSAYAGDDQSTLGRLTHAITRLALIKTAFSAQAATTTSAPDVTDAATLTDEYAVESPLAPRPEVVESLKQSMKEKYAAVSATYTLALTLFICLIITPCLSQKKQRLKEKYRGYLTQLQDRGERLREQEVDELRGRYELLLARCPPSGSGVRVLLDEDNRLESLVIYPELLHPDAALELVRRVLSRCVTAEDREALVRGASETQ